MRPEEVSELSRLLDAALALDPIARTAWLAELARTQPETAEHLRSMLRQTQATDTSLLPKLPTVESDDAVANVGERVGPYVLVREIGHGGMGSVWLADRADGTFKRRVALKLPRLTWAAGLGKRMARERNIGALLEHPHIARLYDAGVDEHGRPYIAMEYIEGQPIDLFSREHGLGINERLRLFLQVVKAVAYAHGHLVLHRDLKPGNVLVDAGGQAHLLDFGIAKLLDAADTTGTQLTQELGRALTLTYAAPEQIAGKPLAVTADVYSLGVLLYELLTGSLPYRTKRDTPSALEEAILAGDAPLASSRTMDKSAARALRGDLDAIIGKALKREPNERYPTADALAADIQRYLDGQAIEARPDSTWYRLRKAAVRHRMPLGAGAAILLALLIGGVGMLLQARKTAEEAERAQVATAFVAELFRVDASQPLFLDGTGSRATQAVLLERGAKLIEARFEKQPAIRAELYGAVGRVYVELGQPRLGSEFGNRQLQILREQHAADRQVAQSFILLTEAALTAHRDADAESYAQQAVDSLRSDQSERAYALAMLARTQVANGKLTQAAQTISEGKSTVAAMNLQSSLAMSWLSWDEAQLLRIHNRFNEGLPIQLRAIEEALAAEGPHSSAAFDMRVETAGMLISRNRPQEARKLRDEAIRSFESLGGVHRIRAELAKADLAYREFTDGHLSYAEAVGVIQPAKSFLALQSAVPAELLAQVDLNLAAINQAYGEYAKAEVLLDRSIPLLRAVSQSLMDQLCIVAIAGVNQTGVGEHAAADVSLREAVRLRHQMGHDRFPFTALQWYFVAMNLNMQGLHEQAEAFLANAPKFGDMGGDSTYIQDLLPRTLAQIRLDARNLDGARQAIASLKGADSVDGPWRNYGNYEYFYLLGQLGCAAGDLKTGLSNFAIAEPAFSAHASPNSPELARMRAQIGLCALSTGDRKLAEQMATQARTAFQEQPRVSLYWKEPLQQLETRLGTKSIH